MPRIIITAAAKLGLDRCRDFLVAKSPEAARRAATAISRSLAALETSPQIARPFRDHPDLRELLIPFGDAGYVALYTHDRQKDEILILAFRHQKEAGY